MLALNIDPSLELRRRAENHETNVNIVDSLSLGAQSSGMPYQLPRVALLPTFQAR